MIYGISQQMHPKNRIFNALEVAMTYGQSDGEHHKAWVIDQMVRMLCGDEDLYNALIIEYKDGCNGPNTYEWFSGIAP